MKVCSRCGAQNQDQAAVCYACGTQFPVPQANPYQQPMYPGVPAKVPGKGLAIAGMVCGIVGVCFGVFSLGIAWIYGVILGILGVVFGAVAKNKGYRGTMATAGIVLGIVSVALCIILYAACVTAVNSAVNSLYYW